MRQGLRLITKPGTFFNQLQWSTHHWFILFAFLALALVETQTGSNVALYGRLAAVLSARYGIGLNASVWLIAFLKLALMLWGAFSLASILYIVGNLFGRQTSRRVFFRRLAVVFTVLLGAYTAQQVAVSGSNLWWFSLALYAWGALLGFFALREQFELNFLQTAILSALGALLIIGSWQTSHRFIETAIHFEVDSPPATAEIAHRPGAATVPAPAPRR